jgi:hypothetical protein
LSHFSSGDQSFCLGNVQKNNNPIIHR